MNDGGLGLIPVPKNALRDYKGAKRLDRLEMVEEFVSLPVFAPYAPSECSG
jgi:hypothetical protein